MTVTLPMLYNALQDLRKLVMAQDKRIVELTRKVEQYSARVALVIDGDDKNVEN